MADAQPLTTFFFVLLIFIEQLADGFNGADLRNVGTEAGLFAIRADRDYVLEVIFAFFLIVD